MISGTPEPSSRPGAGRLSPFAALTALLLAACGTDSAATPTQVMAVISAEPAVSEITADVRIVVRSGQGEDWEERLDRDVATDVAAAWPIEVSITPKSNDATRVYEITATALDDAGIEVAQVRAISGFVESKALLLALVFEQSCLGKVAECDATETCRAGNCEDAHVDVALLPPYSGAEGLIPFVDGGAPDGGGDAAVSMLDSGSTQSPKDAATGGQDGDTMPTDGSTPGMFAPANVDLATLDFALAPATVLGCGDAVVDTGDPITITGWCGDLPVTKLRSQIGGPELVILPLRSLAVPDGTTLTLTGPRPVAIVVDGDVTISGVVDASTDGSTAGPGGGLMEFCTGGAGGRPSVVTGTSAFGGAGGGGFGSIGGAGGATIISGMQGAGGLAGAIDGTDSLVPLRGGCSSVLDQPAGGALQISASGTITITSGGVVVASGAGGGTFGLPTSPSGAGGSSGGAILLEGGSVATEGAVRAHGGGGGSSGPLGQDGHRLDDAPAAGAGSGGQGGVLCVGAACTAATAGPTNGSASSNGGGGGGGYGRIVIRTW
jgi:hypothetical protein